MQWPQHFVDEAPWTCDGTCGAAWVSVRPWLLVLAACAHAPVSSPRCTLPLATGGDVTFGGAHQRSGTVASVSIEGAPALAPLLRGVIETHTGQLVADAPLAEDLRRLWAFDVLADARIDAHETPAGVAIVFAVEPEPRIAAVHGADAPELRRLRWLAGSPYEPKRIARITREIEAAYLRDGYLDATVAVRRSRNLDLCVSAYRGPQVTIRRMTFPGAHAVAPSVLLGVLHGKDLNRPGGTYDEQALTDDSVFLVNEYYERGMIEAKVGTPKLERYNDKLDVAVPITEGAVFHLGELRGLVVPTTLHRGDLFVRSKVSGAVTELSTALDATVVPITTLDTEHQRIDLTFEITWRTPWSALRLLHWH